MRPFPIQKNMALVDDNGTATAYFMGWLNAVTSSFNGFTGTITTAPLTVGGTAGSMTFANGVVISQVPAT